MSRRAATIVQADIARAGRAAKQLGPEWLVEIEGGVIRLVRGEQLATRAPARSSSEQFAPEPKVRL